jgi:biotin carboxyl carrier protein
MEKKDNLGTLNINSTLYRTRLSRKFIERKPFSPEQPGLVMSFIPGTIVDILVQEGEKVKKGMDLLVLDAMKMQNRLKSHTEGTVKNIYIKKGDRVPKGTLLIEIS